MNALLVAMLLAAATGDDALRQARAKYDAVAYDESLAILERALKNPALTASEKARMLAFEALVHAQMADDASAQKNIDDALALDACIALPEAPAPPRVKQMFAAAKDAHTKGLPTPLAATPAPASTPTTTTTGPHDAAHAAGASFAFPAAFALGGAGLVTLAAAGVASGLAYGAHADAGAASFASDAVAKDEIARSDLLVADALAVAGGALVVAAAGFAAAGVLGE